MNADGWGEFLTQNWLRLILAVASYQVPYWSTLWLTGYWRDDVQGWDAALRLVLAIGLGATVSIAHGRWERRQDQIERDRVAQSN